MQISNPLPPSFVWTKTASYIPPRWGHTLVDFSHVLLMFGGFSGQYLSDLWVYDLNVFKWSQIYLTNPPEPRSHHSAVSFNHMKTQNCEKMIVYGGKTKNNRVLGDLYELDWGLKRWRIIENKGNVSYPSGRSGHSANILLEEFMVIYGGENIVDLNDFWILDLKNYHWTKTIVYGKAPHPRKFHASCVHQDNLYIIGGCFENYESLGDVFMINFKDFKTGGILHWQEVKFSGSFPCRWGHSIVNYKNKLYVFGGKNEVDLHDFHCFNVKTSEFHEIEQNGMLPCARRRQMMVIVGATIIMVGGFNGNYLNDMHLVNVFHLKTPIFNRKKEEINNVDKNKEIKILCEDRPFFCNKAKMMAKSGYFKAFFSKPFYEEETKCVQIKMISSKILEKILEFIEYGEINENNLTEGEEIQILKASNFFIMDELILIMQKQIIKQLMENDSCKETDKILDFYEISVNWNLDFLLKFILVLIALRIDTINSKFIKDLENISFENFERNSEKIEKMRKDLNFWKNFTQSNVAKNNQI